MTCHKQPMPQNFVWAESQVPADLLTSRSSIASIQVPLKIPALPGIKSFCLILFFSYLRI